MKAWVVDEYSDQARFRRTEVDKPELTPGHVLIEVKATSLNPIDHKILTGAVPVGPDLPGILHIDVSGIVTAVGDGVGNFKPGDEVYGCAGGLKGSAGSLDGALADVMLADADLIALKPKSLDFGEAAALPLVAITAWEALIDQAAVTADDTVLVHGGTGGVGHLGVQLAASRGCRVATTVSSKEKADIAKRLGADEVIDYTLEQVEAYVQRLTEGRGFSVVFDTIGGDNLDRSFEAAAIKGRLAGTIGRNTHDLSPMHSKALSLHLVFMALPLLTGEGRAHHGDILRELSALVDAGKVKPLVHSKRFSFDQANEAHSLFVSGDYIGKIVLEHD
ncbi:zinc-dependent alcohol dehydrogenase family protein [Allohahella marinimesophila]|uniref:Zinc-dependent alcohol dehydrogenase family protein n=1 Tax=Allohahella marinimesophila TaxID=1054972 RepID=A0ABP7PMB2_9GAMM